MEPNWWLVSAPGSLETAARLFWSRRVGEGETVSWGRGREGRLGFKRHRARKRRKFRDRLKDGERETDTSAHTQTRTQNTHKQGGIHREREIQLLEFFPVSR